MAHIYLLFDFAKDEEKAQLARHKLEGWKQAFRLDKKLLYKMERVAATPSPTDGHAKPIKEEKAKEEKTKGKGEAPAKSAAKSEAPAAAVPNDEVKLLVRLAFSGHEKLLEQRWVQRIPVEEPFQGASPKVVKSGDANFEATEKQFEELQ